MVREPGPHSGYDVGQSWKLQPVSSPAAWKYAAGWRVRRLHWQTQSAQLHVQEQVQKVVQAVVQATERMNVQLKTTIKGGEAMREEHKAAVAGVVGSLEEITAIQGGIIERMEGIEGEIMAAAGEERESAQNAFNHLRKAREAAHDARNHLSICSAELARYGDGF